MRSKDKLLLTATRAGMELTWLYAWAAFVLVAAMHRTFPLPEALAAFFLGALSTRTHWISGQGWRLFFIPVFQIIGFALAAALIFYDFTGRTHSFLSSGWLTAFFLQDRSAQDWLNLIVIGFFIVVFWIGGILWALRSDTYYNVSRQFDLGVTAFLALFLIKLLLAYKGGIHVRDPYSELLMFPFFIFSLLALGLINQQGYAPRTFLSGFQGIGLMLSFTAIVLGIGTAIVFWFLPFLTTAAEAGFSALKTAASPLGQVIFSILRLYGQGWDRQKPAGGASGGGESHLADIPADSGEGVFFRELIGWTMAIVVGLLALVVICVGMWYLFKWLWHKIMQASEREVQHVSFRDAAVKLWLALVRICLGVAGYLSGCTTATQVFAAIGRWGRRSGIPRQTGETPMEYGLRLSGRFPRFNHQFDIIVNAYHDEVYAGASLDAGKLKTAQAALRRLRSPRHWPVRMASYFFGMNVNGRDAF